MPQGWARWYRAKYAPTPWGEIKKSVDFDEGEGIRACGRVRRRLVGIYYPPCALVITTRRFLVLTHHAFAPDNILEVPWPAVRELSTGKKNRIDVSYQGSEYPEVVSLFPFRSERPFGEEKFLTETLQAIDRIFVKGWRYIEDHDQLREDLQGAFDSHNKSAEPT